MVQHGLSSFRPTEVILTHERKVRNTKRGRVFRIFLECIKMTSTGVELDRPQLQQWLSFLEHNNSQKTQLLLQACAITMFMIHLATPSVLLILIDAGFSSCRI